MRSDAPARPDISRAGCTRDTPRCPEATDPALSTPSCCRRHLVVLASVVAPLLRAVGVEFFLDGGGLLGAIRNPLMGLQPGMLPHDCDLDFAIRWEGERTGEQLDQVRLGLPGLGYHWLYKPLARGGLYGGGDYWKACYSEANRTSVDLFPWLERPDGTFFRRQYVRVDRHKGREFPRSMVWPLGEVVWEGMTLPAPRDPEAFLELRYGADWRTPINTRTDGVRR